MQPGLGVGGEAVGDRGGSLQVSWVTGESFWKGAQPPELAPCNSGKGWTQQAYTWREELKAWLGLWVQVRIESEEGPGVLGSEGSGPGAGQRGRPCSSPCPISGAPGVRGSVGKASVLANSEVRAGLESTLGMEDLRGTVISRMSLWRKSRPTPWMMVKKTPAAFFLLIS